MNATQSWSNTDAQIEAETINQELTRLYDLQQEAYNQNSDAVTDLYKRTEELQVKLNNLYTFGWDPINELYAEIDSLQGTAGFTSTGVATGDIEARIAEQESLIAYYNEQRDIAVKNLKESSSGSFDAAGNPITTGDLAAQIAEVEAYWTGLIDQATKAILEYKSQIGTTSENDARIQNLKLQARELEDALNTEIAQLENTINELYRQANNGSAGDTSPIEDIQRQIDALHDRLTEIWQADPTKSLQNLRLVQELEKKARDMQEELEQTTYRLEEELWDLDDKINVYWKVQTDQQQDREAELRREQNLIDDRFDAIQAVEQEELGSLKEQINALEEELRTFRDQQRELDAQLREGQILVEEKR